MFEFFKGKLAKKAVSFAVIDAGGVGYKLIVSATTYSDLPEVGAQATLFAHMHMTDNDVRLFGFSTERERDLFKLLITVNQVGPNTAMNCLSGIPADRLLKAIANKDEHLLSKTKGIGPKTAKRIVIELSDKLDAIAFEMSEGGAGQPEKSGFSDAVEALIVLGYKRPDAEAAILKARETLGPDAGVEDLIRKGLQNA